MTVSLSAAAGLCVVSDGCRSATGQVGDEGAVFDGEDTVGSVSVVFGGFLPLAQTAGLVGEFGAIGNDQFGPCDLVVFRCEVPAGGQTVRVGLTRQAASDVLELCSSAGRVARAAFDLWVDRLERLRTSRTTSVTACRCSTWLRTR